MPVNFRKTESPARAVRRVCRERIGEARARLRHSDQPSAVHGARKEIKKLRALFRLVRDEIGKDVYRKAAKSLRKAANRLAAARDARVMLVALEKLAGRQVKQFAEIRAALKQHARRKARQFRKDDSVALAGRLLRKTGRRVSCLKIKAAGRDMIEPGFLESYRRGRAASQRVGRKPSPEHFHDWRKHVKDLWFYFSLLHPARSTAAGAMRDGLKLLGEQLGEDHDLFLVQEFVAEQRTLPAGEVKRLGRLIESRQKRLRKAAMKLGSRLYADAPAAFRARLGHDWRAWFNGR